jgi:hypothetical protein
MLNSGLSIRNVVSHKFPGEKYTEKKPVVPTVSSVSEVISAA